VRNPSWSKATDKLRFAYPDRIVVQVGGTPADIANKVTANELDVLLVEPTPPSVVKQYQSSRALRGRLHSNPKISIDYFPINVAQPPFDDVHVRRAVNYVLDRAAIRRVRGGTTAGELASHYFGTQQSELRGYTPYISRSHAQGLERARAEMRKSKYDPGRTGRCTAAECRNVLAVPYTPSAPENVLIRNFFSEIGIELAYTSFAGDAAWGKCTDPKAKVALCLNLRFGPFNPDPGAHDFFFMSSAIGPDGCCNLSLLGATPKQLKSWGYGSVPVPSLDRALGACSQLAGSARVRCYVQINKRITEQIVPGLPILFPNQLEIVSNRITNYTYDFFGYVSLNQVALKPGSD
jgi:ABC-type transport system substrate-binding protein